MNNGIFDYATRTLLPFRRDLVFLNKARTDFDENAQSPILHNDEDGTDWEIEEWVQQLSDDAEVVELLWQILGAVVRPNVHFDKAAFFVSEIGNNGKGSLCQLGRNLVGNGDWISIGLTEFSGEFRLQPLLQGGPIIVDENEVGARCGSSGECERARDPSDSTANGRCQRAAVHLTYDTEAG